MRMNKYIHQLRYNQAAELVSRHNRSIQTSTIFWAKSLTPPWIVRRSLFSTSGTCQVQKFYISSMHQNGNWYHYNFSYVAPLIMVILSSTIFLNNENSRFDANGDTERNSQKQHYDTSTYLDRIATMCFPKGISLPYCECAASIKTTNKSTEQQRQHRKKLLRNRQTVRKMEADSCTEKLEHRYYVNWNEPLGEGSFGVVYLGMDQNSKERVAVKKISKKYTGAHDLQREIHALLHLRDAGGHPNICSLRETFSEDGYYYLILDLIEGCEMFEHLVSRGAYSEADAARLVREVASALAFLHGGPGLVHCDLKPENLMLSSLNPSDAVIKLIDFGCAVVIGDDDDDNEIMKSTGRTLAYCPPEVLNSNSRTAINPAVDMWAMGVIIYIMLTGLHPFDLSGHSSDEEVAQEIVQGKPPPLRNSPITAHLSDSAIDLIDQLMQTDPQKRITADEMLEHPWTRGLTASQEVMVGSDKKLSMYRVYKSGIAEKVFQNIITWSDDQDNNDVSRRTSLIERSFRAFDPQQKGYLTQNDLQGIAPKEPSSSSPSPPYEIIEPTDQDSSRLSLSGFSELLAENMKNKYFPKGSIIYREGDEGNAMYVINSGTISVETLGSVVKRGPGDFFGEGAVSKTKECKYYVFSLFEY
jgi:serine/threonine protein kinase